MKSKREVDYFHILLELNEILISEGLAPESLFPGPAALDILQTGQREEIFALFPGLRKDRANGYGPQAREAMTVSEVKMAVIDVNRNERKLCPRLGYFKFCATA